MNAKTILAGFRQACFCPEQNPWSRLLESILREWEEETNNRPRKTDETLEYLYEALHEYQREPAPPGMVYLSTVHAAKGLEFDRVILSSNWHRQHDPKRHEEERRLFYVGMTRARKKLMMCALENRPHPFLREIAGEHVRRLRAAAPDEPADHDLKHHYTLLGPSSVWLNYPAVATNGSHMRRAIAELQPGTPIRLKLQGRRIFMLTCSNEPVGALSAAAHEQWGERLHQILHARVHAMIVWRKEYENDPPERMPDQWEVPLLEISHHPSA